MRYILSSLKIMIIFNNTSADFVLMSTEDRATVFLNWTDFNHDNKICYQPRVVNNHHSFFFNVVNIVAKRKFLHQKPKIQKMFKNIYSAASHTNYELVLPCHLPPIGCNLNKYSKKSYSHFSQFYSFIYSNVSKKECITYFWKQFHLLSDSAQLQHNRLYLYIQHQESHESTIK